MNVKLRMINLKDHPLHGFVQLGPGDHLRKSMLAREPSMLGRTELLELLRRLARCSPGSEGFMPDDLAKRLRISVRETTPVRRPERLAPGRAEAGTLCWTCCGRGEGGVEPEPGIRTDPPVGARSGVAGAEGEGEADSTTHMRWAWVATSFATVCARVEYGLT